MLERLAELNALLNMDEREENAEEVEVVEASEVNEDRTVRGSIHEKLQISKEKNQRESENGKISRNHDFGLE